MRIFFAICFFLTYSLQGFSFQDAYGRHISDAMLENKWIIINYWADWCDSCLEEIPELNNFYKNNQDNNIIILGVNYDKLPPLDLRLAIVKTGIMFPVLQDDPTNKWRLGEITVLPTTYIINPNGDIVRKIIGPNTEQSLLKIIHNKLYGKKKSNQGMLASAAKFHSRRPS